MDVNEYLCDRLVRDRLNEARARAATEALVQAGRPPRRSIRHVVGNAFVTFGHWVLAEGAAYRPQRRLGATFISGPPSSRGRLTAPNLKGPEPQRPRTPRPADRHGVSA